MPRFSANLGFLWTDRPLADAIRAAKKAGFDAVECHWPYAEPVDQVLTSLKDTGLPMLGLNTVRGPQNAGMAALADQVTECRAAIDQALEYGQIIGAKNIHVMAGKSQGAAAEKVYIENLKYASDRAGERGMSILIEPLNPYDMPGYFLRDTVHAADILTGVNRSNVRLMFDCYHVGRTEGDVLKRFDSCLPLIGHIQFAAVPDRGAPDHGEVDYAEIFRHIDASGWSEPLGAEYKVEGATEDSLGWMQTFGA